MAVPRNRKRGQDAPIPVPEPPRQRELPMPHLPKDWESNEIVRRRILWDGRLLAWPKAELIGVASYKAASLNGEVLTIFFNAWVAECDAPKSPGVPLMKEQARALQCLLLPMFEVLRLCKLCGKDDPVVRSLKHILLAKWFPERLHELDDPPVAEEEQDDDDDLEFPLADLPEDDEEGELDGDDGEANEEGKDCEDTSEQDQEEGVQEELAQDVKERLEEQRVQEEPNKAQEEKPRAPCKVPSFEIFAPVEVNSSEDEAPAPTPTLNPCASERKQKLKELQARLKELKQQQAAAQKVRSSTAASFAAKCRADTLAYDAGAALEAWAPHAAVLTVADSQDPEATDPVPNRSDAPSEPSPTLNRQPPKPRDLISADIEQTDQKAQAPMNGDCSAQPPDENASKSRKPEAEPIASAESGQEADVPRGSNATPEPAPKSRGVPMLRSTQSRADFYEAKAGGLRGF
ncbi:unnamed protein product [Symbiodinium sp. CCMP2592]|nr:unnamed protein product [Symbiodinium sp. CCMP2592]